MTNLTQVKHIRGIKNQLTYFFASIKACLNTTDSQVMIDVFA